MKNVNFYLRVEAAKRISKNDGNYAREDLPLLCGWKDLLANIHKPQPEQESLSQLRKRNRINTDEL
jgi:hypothetical protein